MRAYLLSEITNFRDVMNINDRKEFVTKFAREVENLLFMEQAMRQTHNPLNTGDEMSASMSHFDLSHSAAQEWRMACYCFDDVYDIRRCLEILKSWRFIAGCQERLRKLRGGGIRQFFRNYRKRALVRRYIRQEDFHVTMHELFNLAVYKYYKKGWGNADALREELLHIVY